MPNIKPKNVKPTLYPTSIWKILLLTGVILTICIWNMVTINFLFKSLLFCSLFFIPMSMPVFLYSFIERYTNRSKVSIAILSAFIILVIPLFFNVVYFYNLNSFKSFIPVTGNVDIKISANEILLYNNHVGHDWKIEHYVNGNLYKANESITIDVCKPLTIKTCCTEFDNIEDYGEFQSIVLLTDKKYTFPIIVTHEIVVVEKGGRYAGNTSEWQIEYKIAKSYDFWDVVFWKTN